MSSCLSDMHDGGGDTKKIPVHKPLCSVVCEVRVVSSIHIYKFIYIYICVYI
jgi:hypothetical protein